MRLDLGLGKRPADSRIVVAMSGGVDSSVTAALLAEAGYEVVGITLQLYDHGAAVGRKGACCAGRDIHDARAVADRLGIPHYVLDFEARFKAAVIDDFAAAYAEGRTPIPCVRCNERVKFRDLLAVARDLGADALATGHYVRREEGPDGPELHRAADPAKDQSYFLFATTREQLGFLRFPLGAFDKATTREHARRFGLSVAGKPDSQDICFVPAGHYSSVVARLQPGALEPGEIVHVDGRVLGRHAGTAHYTVGQRRGLGVADGERLYVVGIEPRARRVVVGPKEASYCGTIELMGVNWLAGPAPEGGLEVEVKTRYNEPAVAARVFDLGAGRARVELQEPQPGIAPGQACVFYAGTRLLGGGWIERAPLLWQRPQATQAGFRPAAAIAG
ncbi:tRNA 2-thiouridine(34) synthase MnmA [Benzoatithermus flavus]|uniref:tRNA-specific 2-thiouridylase MnmA n=1 Tax=Benzoatithermus flavus TaxID=3108223 RepID=A0ABU8XMP6_9PROT